MASFNKTGGANSASFDTLLLQSLMGRLQLRPPYLDTNSFLSQSLDEFLLGDQFLQPQPDSEDSSSPYGGGGRERNLLAKEEAKLEKEIIRIVHSGTAKETLKPNSGQSVAIGDHHICVGFHEESGSEYRVWEWHGHIMLFDEENGYSPEYIYGNYFERFAKKGKAAMPEKEDEEEEEEDEEEEGGGNSGLKDLIGDGKESVGGAGGRVIHRNSLNTGSARIQRERGCRQIGGIFLIFSDAVSSSLRVNEAGYFLTEGIPIDPSSMTRSQRRKNVLR